VKNAHEIVVALRRLDYLEGVLYEKEPSGGPLHIVSDDGNVRDSDLIFCFRWLHENPTGSVWIDSVCLEILNILALMTEPQRIVWWIDRSGAVEELSRTILLVHDGKVARNEEEGGSMDWDVEIYAQDGHVLWKGKP